MTTIYIIKIIYAVIIFSVMATWYAFCWLAEKREKFEKPAFVLTLIMAGLAILTFILASFDV